MTTTTNVLTRAARIKAGISPPPPLFTAEKSGETTRDAGEATSGRSGQDTKATRIGGGGELAARGGRGRPRRRPKHLREESQSPGIGRPSKRQKKKKKRKEKKLSSASSSCCVDLHTRRESESESESGRIGDSAGSSSSDEAGGNSTWVQCDRETCRKWRRLSGHAPSSASSSSSCSSALALALDPSRKWFCDMNPDPARQSCAAPQERVPNKRRLFTFSRLEPGQLLWARLQGYPPWPAVLSPDPWTNEGAGGAGGEYVSEEKDLGGCCIYHVEFLGRPRSHCWLPEDEVELYGQNCSLGLPKMSKKLIVAMEQADALVSCSPAERLAACHFTKENASLFNKRKGRNKDRGMEKGKEKDSKKVKCNDQAEPKIGSQLNTDNKIQPLTSAAKNLSPKTASSGSTNAGPALSLSLQRVLSDWLRTTTGTCITAPLHTFGNFGGQGAGSEPPPPLPPPSSSCQHTSTGQIARAHAASVISTAGNRHMSVSTGNRHALVPVISTSTSVPVISTGNGHASVPVISTGNGQASVPVISTGNGHASVPVINTGNGHASAPVISTGKGSLAISASNRCMSAGSDPPQVRQTDHRDQVVPCEPDSRVSQWLEGDQDSVPPEVVQLEACVHEEMEEILKLLDAVEQKEASQQQKQSASLANPVPDNEINTIFSELSEINDILKCLS